MVLGRYRRSALLRSTTGSIPVADKLADAAEALSRDCVGALIAIEREVALAAYVETGERDRRRGLAVAAADHVQQATARCTTGR